MLNIKSRSVKVSAIALAIFAAAVLLAMWITPMQASAPAAPTDSFTCTPTAVAAFSTRVHVRCSPAAPGSIAYFAVCTTSDPANAARFLSIFTTAKVTGKNLVIFYTPSDTSGTACGCSAVDCRLTYGAEVQQ